MMNPTMFDPIALENWYFDDENSLLLQTELEKYFHNYLPCFRSEPQRKLIQTFITELLIPLERKSIEPVALHFSGEKYVRPMQQFFSRSPFEEQPLLDIYQELLSKQVGQAPGMLSVDDTCFVKKGKHSAGVKRQYCGRLGKTENCQSGVFLAFAGDSGHGLADYELYLPQEWFGEDFAQLYKERHIPEEKTFSTKNDIAIRLLNQAVHSGLFQSPVGWLRCGIRRGRPRKYPALSAKPVSVREIAEDSSVPLETIVLAEGVKGPILAQRKYIRCYSCRKDRNRSHVKSGPKIWLYLRKYTSLQLLKFPKT